MKINLSELSISMAGGFCTCLLAFWLIGTLPDPDLLIGIWLFSSFFFLAGVDLISQYRLASGIILIFSQVVATFITYRSFVISPDSLLGRVPSIVGIAIVFGLYLLCHDVIEKYRRS